MIHQKLSTTTIVEVILHLLVITFQRELPHLVRCMIISTCRQLPTLLRLDVHITQLPSICRTHNAGIADLMNILSHGIESRLYRKVFCKSIATRQTELRTMISLQELVSGDTHRIHYRNIGRQSSRLIGVIITRSHGIEHRITDTSIQRKFRSHLPFFTQINGTFQCFILLQFVKGYQRMCTQRFVSSCTDIIHH